MRKAALLTMAVAVVAIFSIPDSASANWTKHHQPLASGVTVELELTGTDLFFETEVGGVTCSNTITRVDFEAGTTTGKVTTFGPEGSITANCQGRGLIAQCDVHENKADSLPWTGHTAGVGEVTVTTGTLTFTMTGFFCPHTINLTPGTLTWTTSEINTTSTATMSGTLKMDGDLGDNVSVTLSGTMHVLGTITYGI